MFTTIQLILISIVILFLFYISGNIFGYAYNKRINNLVNNNKQEQDYEQFENNYNDTNNKNFNDLITSSEKLKTKEEEENIEGYENKIRSNFKALDPTVFVDNKDICCYNHEKCKTGSTVICNYGATNYAYPKDMSPIDYKIFKLNYSNNFTLQDYINWLWCFNDHMEDLPYNHLKNLIKLQNGEKLVYKKGILPPPARIQPPLNSKEYFERLYKNGQINIAAPLHSVTGSLLGYNYNDYPNFFQNFNQYGSSGRIYNIKDLKKKYSAKFLNKVLTPKVKSSQDKYTTNTDPVIIPGYN